MFENGQSVVRPGAQVRADIDAGLRAYMNRVYMLMAVAMVVTGAVSMFFGFELKAAVNGQETMFLPAATLISMFTGPFKWVLMLAPLGLVLLLSFRIHAMSAATAQGTFWLYSALVGVSISTIFVVFSLGSIAMTFFVTAVAFLGLSIYGYTTKRDLSAVGRFAMMALIGLIIVMIVGIFFPPSDTMQLVIAGIGVLIFAALTAYDTQAIKNEYLAMAHAGPEGEAFMEKGAIMGALRLYLDFLNMFLFMLQFLGASDD